MLWIDTVSLTDSASVWKNVYGYQAQDGSAFSVVYDQPESVPGPGHFYAQFAVKFPARGHTATVFFENPGTSPNSLNGWQAITGFATIATSTSGEHSLAIH